MTYRTKTYIAADWTGDSNAVQQLYNWKNGQRWSLDFHVAMQKMENGTHVWDYEAVKKVMGQ